MPFIKIIRYGAIAIKQGTIVLFSSYNFLDFYEEPDQSKNIADINRICSEHIAELVKLKWLLNATDSVGAASLKGITLNSRMLDIVRMSPLEWGNHDLFN